MLPNDPIITDKFNKAHNELNEILNKYLNEMYEIYLNILHKDGYNIYRHPINIGPKEYNTYSGLDNAFHFY